MTESYPRALERDIAALLGALELGTFDDAAPAYPPSARGIYYARLSTPLADEMILVTAGMFSRNPGSNASGVTPVQLFVRVKGDGVGDVLDAMRLKLEARTPWTLPTVGKVLIGYESGGVLGSDTSGRSEGTLNLRVAARRPILSPQVGAASP